MSGATRVHVAAAVILDPAGRVLIARRPRHVHQGDLWEFPGGKLEPGETAEQALCRELWEELHIRPLRYRPLIRIPFDYPDKQVLLDVWRVDAFDGQAQGREGQPLQWVQPQQLPRYAFPAANRPIVAAARLPARYLITGPHRDDDDFMARLDRALARGLALVQLRLGPQAGARLALLRRAVSACRQAGAIALVNGDPQLALQAGADGVHLPAAALMGLQARPLPARYWCAASCHSATELAQAAALELDFAVLSPVRATASHPEAQPLGWGEFGRLVDQAPLPVYALGGVGEGDLAEAYAGRAQGIAAISAFWG